MFSNYEQILKKNVFKIFTKNICVIQYRGKLTYCKVLYKMKIICCLTNLHYNNSYKIDAVLTDVHHNILLTWNRDRCLLIELVIPNLSRFIFKCIPEIFNERLNLVFVNKITLRIWVLMLWILKKMCYQTLCYVPTYTNEIIVVTKF